MLSLLLNNLFAIAQALLSQYQLFSENLFSFLSLGQLFPEHAIARQLLIEIIYLILVPFLRCNLLDLPEDKHQAGSILEKGELLSGLSFVLLVYILESLGEFIWPAKRIVRTASIPAVNKFSTLRFRRFDVLIEFVVKLVGIQFLCFLSCALIRL